MKLSRTAFIAFFILALPLTAGISVRTARAQESCTITSSDLDAVTAAEAQGLVAELAARRALLTKTITCAKGDAQSLQNNLNGLSVGNDAKTLQSQLAGKLDDAMNYYNIELEKVGGAGVAGTQAIAKEVLAWRQANYDPLTAQVANFTLWTQNQNLFETAKNRLNQMKSAVAFVEGAAPNNDLQTDLANAEVLVQSANDENAQAKTVLLQSLPPDQSLALIQQSLQSLSDAYQKFFAISTIIQTLLPTKPQ